MLDDLKLHAYLDGSLDDDSRREMEKAIESDPNVQRRLDNLKAFLKDIRREGLSEEIPLQRLHAMIPKAPRASWLRLVLRPALAMGVAVAILVWAISPRPPKPIEEVAVSSFAVAANWIRERNPVAIPKFELESAKIVASERSDTSGCFCLMMEGHLVHLGFMRETPALPGLFLRRENGREFRVGKGIVTFEARGLTWIVKADDHASAWKLAVQAAPRIDSAQGAYS